jgi:hypothetical protein
MIVLNDDLDYKERPPGLVLCWLRCCFGAWVRAYMVAYE